MSKQLKVILAAFILVFANSISGYAADKFGAIAYSPGNGAFGYWYNASSQGEANAKAMAECKKRGQGCKVVTRFHNACGAVYAGSNGWGADWGTSKSQAERKAAGQCAKLTGGCRLIAWSCTKR